MYFGMIESLECTYINEFTGFDLDYFTCRAEMYIYVDAKIQYNNHKHYKLRNGDRWANRDGFELAYRQNLTV